MIQPTHHYIGKCKQCGVILASVYDMVDLPKFTGDSVAKMIASGLEVVRVPLGSVGFSADGCSCRANQTVGLPLFQGATTP